MKCQEAVRQIIGITEKSKQGIKSQRDTPWGGKEAGDLQHCYPSSQCRVEKTRLFLA